MARSLERRGLYASEGLVLTPGGLAYLESDRRGSSLRGPQEVDRRAPLVERGWGGVPLAQRHLLDAFMVGVGLDSIRVEVDRLRTRHAGRKRARGQLALGALLQADAVDRRIAETRITRLHEILTHPDFNEVRAALRNAITRVEISGDGGAFMLGGSGPLEPLPGAGDLSLENFGGSPASDSRSRPAIGARDVPGAGPCGHRPVSRLWMVGPAGFDPARSPPELARGGPRVPGRGGRRGRALHGVPRAARGVSRGLRPLRRSASAAPRLRRAYPLGPWFESSRGA